MYGHHHPPSQGAGYSNQYPQPAYPPQYPYPPPHVHNQYPAGYPNTHHYNGNVQHFNNARPNVPYNPALLTHYSTNFNVSNPYTPPNHTHNAYANFPASGVPLATSGNEV